MEKLMRSRYWWIIIVIPAMFAVWFVILAVKADPPHMSDIDDMGFVSLAPAPFDEPETYKIVRVNQYILRTAAAIRVRDQVPVTVLIAYGLIVEPGDRCIGSGYDYQNSPTWRNSVIVVTRKIE